jgi:hypothetical protein
MADPKVVAAPAAIAAAIAEEEETQNATPRRTRRSASAGTSPPGAPPARLTGKTQSTKQLLFSQIEEEPAGVPPLLTQAWNTQLGATESYVCDWAQATVCILTAVKPLPCQKQGCERTVHHLCQGEWERREGHDDVLARYCCQHHPNYKYRAAPEKQPSPDDVTPSRKEKARGRPIDEVCPTASPADSSITGTGGGIFTPSGNKKQKKRKKSTEKEQIVEGTADASDVDNVAERKDPQEPDEPEPTINYVVEEGSPDSVQDGSSDDFSDEVGDMGDSDDEGEEADIHNEATILREMLESSNEPIGDDADNLDDVKGEEFARKVGNTGVQLLGAPEGWVPPGPPPHWTGYQPKGNAPQADDIDNPGAWNLYSFEAKYKKGGVYCGHFTPAGAMVVPVNEKGEREINGWRFHYNGWTPDAFDVGTYVRDDATQQNLKPDSRRGSLDVNVLRKHGCDADRVRSDPLFFYQLLFPFCPPETSGIENDDRMPYYSNLAIFTNVYASTCGAGSGMGHDWRNVTVPELVHWAGVPIRHGSLDGNPGTMFSRWDVNDPRYDATIAESIVRERWKIIKRFFKLNNNLIAAPRGMDGYDPCVKYDFIFKCLIHNMNYVTLCGDLDGTIDETTWGFGGYCGEAGGRLRDKKVSKGGQTTMLYDIHRRYPRAYIHRHKLHKRPEGFNAQGPSEIYDLLRSIDALVVNGDPSDRGVVSIPKPTGYGITQYQLKKIYFKPPHIVADNHFSGDHVMTLFGKKGYGCTMTNRRDRFPQGLKEYLHHDKVPPGCAKAKAMRYVMPIVAIKQCPAGIESKAFTQTLVSFQSTGATNICGVNNLPSVTNYVSKKVRGKGNQKRVWGIEQNEARETYLRHYYGIDNLDHMIKNASNRYLTWKYWHSPYLHAKSMGIIAAYDMYNECCDGLLDPSWAISIKKRMGFTEFRMRLSEQMLQYDPRDNRYAGDDKFRRFTQQHKIRRSGTSVNSADDDVISNDGLTFDVFRRAVREMPRFCATVDQLNNHFRNIKKMNNAAICEVCGTKTIWKCTICCRSLCIMKGRGWNGAKCLMMYHNQDFYGLARGDYKTVHGKNVLGWTAPDDKAIARNARRVKRFLAEMASEGS